MKNEKGFVEIVILVIIALVLLKFFLNFDLFEAADSAQGQETIGYTGQLLRTIWSYIATPATFAWNEIALPLLKIFWNTFQAFITWSQTGVAPSTSIF